MVKELFKVTAPEFNLRDASGEDITLVSLDSSSGPVSVSFYRGLTATQGRFLASFLRLAAQLIDMKAEQVSCKLS